MKAIETFYNGYRFRSRLEARWAVFFDALGVKYEYEPEGFDLGDGDFYLPDFRVKCWGTRGDIDEKPFDLWIEVKGRMTEEDARKIKKFAYFDSCEEDIGNGFKFRRITNPILIVGNIPNVGESEIVTGSSLGSYDMMDGINIYPLNLELVDGDHFGTNILVKNGKLFLGGDDSSYGMSCKETEEAYDLARKARFEYGDSPRKAKPNFFQMEDFEENSIIIRQLDGGYTISHPRFTDLKDEIISRRETEFIIYSVCGDNKLNEFIEWVNEKKRLKKLSNRKKRLEFG